MGRLDGSDQPNAHGCLRQDGQGEYGHFPAPGVAEVRSELNGLCIWLKAGSSLTAYITAY